MNLVEKYLCEKNMGSIRRDFIKFDQTWTHKAENILIELGYKKEADKVEKFMEEIDKIIGRITRSTR